VILTEVERINAVEAFVKATDAEIKTGGNQPMYVPSLDYIVMPPAGAFRTVEHFYATELHEIGHWTAAGSTAISKTASAPRPMQPKNWSPNSRQRSSALTSAFKES
jgi:antirestriction protein ArdC